MTLLQTGRPARKRRALRVGGFSLGWCYAVIVFFLGLNWIWDIVYRIFR